MDTISLDFELAKAKHLLFKSKLRSVLYGLEGADSSVLSHFECAVGKWIYSYALKAYGYLPEMQELEKVHENIHTSARELVALYQSGKVDEARHGLASMEKIADHLVELLTTIEHKIKNEPDTKQSAEETHSKILNELFAKNQQLDVKIQEENKSATQEKKVLHNFFMQAPAIFAILKGPEHLFELANPAYIELIGNQNPTGKTIREALPELKGQGFYELLDHCYKTGEPYSAKEIPVLLNRNGKLEQIFLNFNYQAFNDEHGKTEGILVFAYEVTEQVTARKKIEESEQRLRNILEQAPDPILILKGENMIVEIANKPQLQLWGADKSAIGKPVFDIAPELKEQGFMEMLQDVYCNDKTIRGHETPVTFIGKDGTKTTHYFDFYFQPYREADGHISGVLVMAFNVTKQVESGKKIKEYSEDLKRFKYMADNANEAFILMREDGTFAYLNDLALERWGYTREEAEHIRVPDVDPIYNDDVFNQAFAKAQIEKLPQFETLHKKKDGTIYPVEINMGAVTINDKPHMFAIARDITQRKKTEEKIQHYYEDLEVKVKFRNIALERENKELKNKIEELSKNKK